MVNLIYMLVAFCIIFGMQIRLLKNKEKNILCKEFIVLCGSLEVHVFGLILQIMFQNTSIPPVYFDYISYIGAFFTPVCFFYIALTFRNRNIKIKDYIWLLVIPILSLLILWTNDLHHWFYKVYSINIHEVSMGFAFYIYSIYSYTLIFVAMAMLISTSMKKSGFFSAQTAFIIIGGLVPIVVNILGTLNIINMTIYITPILFIVTSICFSFAIFKYKALNITPIAFKTVINTMSDAYIVISDDGTIVDTNKTFRDKFESIFKFDKDENFFRAIEESKIINLKELKSNIKETRKSGSIVTKEYNFVKDEFNKYFEIDIHPIKATKTTTEYVGTLLLFKDITQHKEDIAIIQEKQEVIVKQQQLVSIGELAGGVAHDINTPISAIKTGIMMLNEMNGQRSDGEKEILDRMDSCATKIVNIVNSMRNQIRNLGGDTNVKFKISSVVNDIKVITYHEVAKNNSEVIVDIQDDLSVKGDPTKLGQVLTNLVVNAVQAYGDNGGKIEITVKKSENEMASITVADNAGGLDEGIEKYIFKNILTTKGTNGTGLGLYLSYSVIKGNFDGELTFKTKKGVGTTFNILIPYV